MDDIRALLARLAELSAAELADAIAAARTLADELAEGELTGTVATELVELADAVDAFTARETELAAEAETAEANAQAALARIRGEQPADGTDGDGTDGDTDGTDGDADADAQVDADREPVTAGGTPRGLPRPGQMSGTRGRTGRVAGGTQTTERPVLQARASLVAAADVSGTAAGAEFASFDAFVEAFDGRRQVVQRARSGNGENVLVASIRNVLPESRQLTDDPARNRQLIRAATDRNDAALVAAGGLCAPIENLYDVDVLGSTARPIRDQALTTFGAPRGGINYRKAPVFQSSDGAVSTWTLAQDASVGDGNGTDPTKPCLEVWCSPTEQAYIDAIPLCMTFHNVTSRTDPEMTAANVQAGLIAHARYAENRLLTKIADLAKTLTAGKVLGATRDLLVMVDKSIAYYRNRHRLADAVSLRAILPRWVRDLIRADLTRALHTSSLDMLAVADAQIDAWFARRNVSITWHLDGRAATSASAGVEVAMAAQAYGDAVDLGVLPGFPDQVEMMLYADGDLLFLDGGSLDLGLVRDSTLNATNTYKTFVETFEGVAFRGTEALRIVATVQPTGQSAGTADTGALAD